MCSIIALHTTTKKTHMHVIYTHSIHFIASDNIHRYLRIGEQAGTKKELAFLLLSSIQLSDYNTTTVVKISI